MNEMNKEGRKIQREFKNEEVRSAREKVIKMEEIMYGKLEFLKKIKQWNRTKT